MPKIKEMFKKLFGSNAHRKTSSNLYPPSLRGPSAPEGSTGTVEPASATISAEPPALPVEPPALPFEPPTLPVEPPTLPVEPSTLPAEPSLEHVDSTKRTDLEELWEIARGGFSKQGATTLPQSAAQASLDGCLASFEQTADIFERETENKENTRNKIKAILQGIEAVSGLLGEGVSIAFPPAKTIFTSVGMLAKAAKKTINQYNLMRQLLDEISAFVDRMNVHKNSPISDEIKKIIVSFLAELLNALVSLSRFMKGNITVFFLAEVCGQDEDINGAIQKMARLAAWEAGMVGVLVHRDVKKIEKRQEDTQEQKLRDKIRSWLSPPDPSTNHEFNRAARRGQEAGQETGNWLLQSPEFIAWRDEWSSHPLWLHGKPGNGKSVLCSTVIDNIMAHCENKPSSAVAYFYFDFRDNAKLNLRGLVCSLIVQMLSQCATMPASIANLFSQHANGGMTAPVDRLEHVFSGLLDCFENSYAIIDALDEPSRDMRKTEVLPFLESLIRAKYPSLHLLVTSRPESDIQLYMGSMNPVRVALSSGLVDDDIKMYIHRILNQDVDLKLWDAEILEKIELSLTKRANGMFRWVDLQLRSLQSCLTEEDIEQALSNLPKDIDETYDRILSAIPDADVPHALRLLHFLAFSLRPLTVKELAETIAVNIERDSDPYVIRKRRLRRATDIFTILSGLVSPADASDSTPVAFVHLSVQEYLISDRIRGKSGTVSKYGLTDKSSHTIIACTCLNYLLQFSTIDCLDGKSRVDFPFAEYAAQYWTQHVLDNKENTLEISEVVLEPASKLMQISGFAFCNWVRIYDLDHPWTGWSRERLRNIPHSLYYASLAGLDDIVRLLLEKGAEVNAKGGEYGTALQAASSRGNNATVQLLLEKGAEVNVQGGYFGTALQAASWSGNNATVQLLLEEGAEVNAQGGRYNNALNAASEGGHHHIMKLLLQNGAIKASTSSLGNNIETPEEDSYDGKDAEIIPGEGEGIPGDDEI